MDARELPQPPSVLRELYGLSSTSETHTSIFYADRDASTFPTPTSPSPDRPFVTLTFAQSLDAKIAGAGGKQLILSGKESLVMTHWYVMFSPIKSQLSRPWARARLLTIVLPPYPIRLAGCARYTTPSSSGSAPH